jgi:hypothetical protein
MVMYISIHKIVKVVVKLHSIISQLKPVNYVQQYYRDVLAVQVIRNVTYVFKRISSIRLIIHAHHASRHWLDVVPVQTA